MGESMSEPSKYSRLIAWFDNVTSGVVAGLIAGVVGGVILAWCLTVPQKTDHPRLPDDKVTKWSPSPRASSTNRSAKTPPAVRPSDRATAVGKVTVPVGVEPVFRTNTAPCIARVLENSDYKYRHSLLVDNDDKTCISLEGMPVMKLSIDLCNGDEAISRSLRVAGTTGSVTYSISDNRSGPYRMIHYKPDLRGYAGWAVRPQNITQMRGKYASIEVQRGLTETEEICSVNVSSERN
jgi:hypothetical protein